MGLHMQLAKTVDKMTCRGAPCSKRHDAPGLLHSTFSLISRKVFFDTSKLTRALWTPPNHLD